MGNKSSSTNITNDVQNFLSQSQNELVNVVTQSIVNISNKIVQEQTAQVISNVSASNIFNGYQIIVRNGAKFSVIQQNYLKSTVEAIINITQDNKLALSLSNQIKNDILTSLSQNADVSNRLAAAATLLKEQQDSGEINGVVTAVKDIASTLIDSAKATEDENNIRNKLIQKIAMKQESSANLVNMINNTINQDINQSTVNNCLQNSSISNMLTLKKIVIDGKNSNFKITQSNILDSFYKCMISSTIKSVDLQNISNSILNTAKQTGDQGVTAKNDMSATKSSIDKTINSSWLDSLSGSIGIIVIVIIVLVAIFIFYKFISKSGGSVVVQSGSQSSFSDRLAYRRQNRLFRPAALQGPRNQSNPPPAYEPPQNAATRPLVRSVSGYENPRPRPKGEFRNPPLAQSVPEDAGYMTVGNSKWDKARLNMGAVNKLKQEGRNLDFLRQWGNPESEYYQRKLPGESFA